MGDRTYTTINFRTEYLPLFSAAYEEKFNGGEYYNIEEGGPLTELIEEEAAMIMEHKMGVEVDPPHG